VKKLRIFAGDRGKRLGDEKNLRESSEGKQWVLEPSKRAKSASLCGRKAHMLQGVGSGSDSRDQAQKNR
jgi:hypothetical protein